MKNQFSNAHTLSQKTSIGNLNLNIHPKEYILLMLKFAPKDKVMGLWHELWDGVSDYDLLPAGCRTLMASVVNKIQQLELEEDWKQLNGIDLTFLSGLPRFVWAKNKIMQKQTIRIAEYVKSSGIEIVALKGTAELLSGEKSDNMRSTSDIDILIKLEDLDLFRQKVSEIGYYEVKNDEGFKKIISFLQKDEFLFRSVNEFQLDIDVHISVEKFYENNRITNLVWQNKVPSTLGDNLFIPSTNERFLISLLNGFRFHNWYFGSYLKYLSDSLIYFELMDDDTFLELKNYQSEMVDIIEWSNQIIELGACLGGMDNHLFEKLKLRQIGLPSNNNVSTPSNITASSRSIFKRLFSELPLDKQFVILINIDTYKYCWHNSRSSIFKLFFYHAIISILFVGNFAFTFINNLKLNKKLTGIVTPVSNVLIR